MNIVGIQVEDAFESAEMSEHQSNMKSPKTLKRREQNKDLIDIQNTNSCGTVHDNALLPSDHAVARKEHSVDAEKLNRASKSEETKSPQEAAQVIQEDHHRSLNVVEEETPEK